MIYLMVIAVMKHIWWLSSYGPVMIDGIEPSLLVVQKGPLRDGRGSSMIICRDT